LNRAAEGEVKTRGSDRRRLRRRVAGFVPTRGALYMCGRGADLGSPQADKARLISIAAFLITLMLYSGKTYTMVRKQDDPGIMVLSLHTIFYYIKLDNSLDNFEVSCLYLEVYNEVGVNIPSPSTVQGKKKTLKETNRNLDQIIPLAKELQASTNIRLLWGSAQLFLHPRYMQGVATSPRASHAGGMRRFVILHSGSKQRNGEHSDFTRKMPVSSMSTGIGHSSSCDDHSLQQFPCDSLGLVGSSRFLPRFLVLFAFFQLLGFRLVFELVSSLCYLFICLFVFVCVGA
ncbi:hypothetical protein Dimus_008308, partial [Dionaea muscipula]